MKKKLFYLTLFFSITMFGQKSNATFKETIDFLKQNLNIYDNNESLNGTIVIEFNKSTNILKYTYTFSLKVGDQKTTTNVWLIPIAKINPNNITIESTDKFNWLRLYTNNGEKLIKYNQKGDDNIDSNENEFWFRISKTTMPKENLIKIQNALTRLIKLSGGK